MLPLIIGAVGLIAYGLFEENKKPKVAKKMAKGGEVGKIYLHTYKLTYPDGRYVVEVYEGEPLSPKEAMEKMRISIRGLKSYKYSGASIDSEKYKQWHERKDIGYSDTEAWDEVFGNKMAKGGNVFNPSNTPITFNVYDGEKIVFKTKSLNKASDYITTNGKHLSLVSVDSKGNAKKLMAKGGNLKEPQEAYIVWVSKDGNKREFYKEVKSLKAAKMMLDKIWQTDEYDSVGLTSLSNYEKSGFYAKGGGVDFEVAESVAKRFDNKQDAQNWINKNSKNTKSKFRIDEVQYDWGIDYRVIEEYERRKMAKGGDIERNPKKNSFQDMFEWYLKNNESPISKGNLMNMAYENTNSVDSAIPQSLVGELDNSFFYVYDYQKSTFGELVDLRLKLKFSNVKVNVTIVVNGEVLYKDKLPSELENATFHQALNYVFKHNEIEAFDIRPKQLMANGGNLKNENTKSNRSAKVSVAKKSGSNAIQKRVDEVNEMINFANENNIEVVDKNSTWQTPMKYNPLKYSRGILFVSYQSLDLYKFNKGQGESWKKENDKFGKDDVKDVLTDIARMYRSSIRRYKTYGY